MALFQVDTEKSLGSEFWSNRYIIDASSFANAAGIGEEIVDAERLAHNNAVLFTRFRTSDPNSDQFLVTPVGAAGLRAVTGLLPLFNTLRFDLPAVSGRPSRKFYRGVLGESDIGGSIVATTFTEFRDAISLLRKTTAEGQGIVDPQGQLLTAVVQHPFVQMRQLRRGTRRRSTPIFP